jgi:Tfp pilus assembly major pilin PilA
LLRVVDGGTGAMMKKLIVTAAALLTIAGCALSAWADDHRCPPGQAWVCGMDSNGREVCLCR